MKKSHDILYSPGYLFHLYKTSVWVVEVVPIKKKRLESLTHMG